MYNVQGLHLHTFSFSAEVLLTAFTSSAVPVHSSTNLLTNFFWTYSFHSPNMDQHHMIYHIHTQNY